CQRMLAALPSRVRRLDPPGARPTGDVTSETEVMRQWRVRAHPEVCVACADRLLANLEVRRFVRFDSPTPRLYHIHCVYDKQRHLYFFANTTESDISVRAVFADAELGLERWDPETVVRELYPINHDGKTLLALAPGESLLLV